MDWAYLMIKGDIDRLLEILKKIVVLIVVFMLFPNISEHFDFRSTLIMSEHTFLHDSIAVWAP